MEVVGSCQLAAQQLMRCCDWAAARAELTVHGESGHALRGDTNALETTATSAPIYTALVMRDVINLPGSCWAAIQQLALGGLSSSLRSEAF